MGVGFIEMMSTPNWTIEEDLEMIAMENKYGTPKDPKEAAK